MHNPGNTGNHAFAVVDFSLLCTTFISRRYRMKKLNNPTGTGSVSKAPVPYRVAKAAFEKAYLTDLLNWSKGNVKRAAEQAGRDRKGLYVLMNKHGLHPMSFRKRTR